MTILFGTTSSLNRSINLYVTGDAYDYNVFDIASTASPGFLPSRNVSNSSVNVIVSSGVIIGCSSTLQYAFEVGTGWGSGWSLNLILQSGSARIQGCGGNGGNGRRVAQIGPSGNVYNGSGGGGAGQFGGGSSSAGPDFGNPGATGTSTAGGAGASGEVFYAGSLLGTVAATAGGDGGYAIHIPTGAPTLNIRAENSSTWEIWGGGGGGGGRNDTGAAGTGGGPGLNGVAGHGAGGLHGVAVFKGVGASFTTFGTMDIRGA